ncbi:MAG: DUF6527 family protein [Candidatus Moraniibacteriota bacterium]
MLKDVLNYIRKRLINVTPKRYVEYTGVLFRENSQFSENELKNRNIIIIGDKDNPKWIHLICPCGCGNKISLNLMKSYYPRWKARFNKDNTLSIFPSIDNASCGAHFWVDHSKVFWAKYK